MSERNGAICRRYVAGATLQEVSQEFLLSRERVRQILRKAGVFKGDRLRPSHLGLRDGVVESSARDVFLGINISERDKVALRAEAERRGISMSALTSDLIKDMLATLEVQ